MGKKALAREGERFHLELDAAIAAGAFVRSESVDAIRKKLLKATIIGTYGGIGDLSSRNPSGE